jgi:hypothetical protein
MDCPEAENGFNHDTELSLRFILKTGANSVSVFERGGADKSLARPTSRCRRTESIVPLERGVIDSVGAWLDGQPSEFFFKWLAKVRATG